MKANFKLLLIISCYEPYMRVIILVINQLDAQNFVLQ